MILLWCNHNTYTPNNILISFHPFPFTPLLKSVFFIISALNYPKMKSTVVTRNRFVHIMIGCRFISATKAICNVVIIRYSAYKSVHNLPSNYHMSIDIHHPRFSLYTSYFVSTTIEIFYKYNSMLLSQKSHCAKKLHFYFELSQLFRIPCLTFFKTFHTSCLGIYIVKHLLYCRITSVIYFLYSRSDFVF